MLVYQRVKLRVVFIIRSCLESETSLHHYVLTLWTSGPIFYYH